MSDEPERWLRNRWPDVAAIEVGPRPYVPSGNAVWAKARGAQCSHCTCVGVSKRRLATVLRLIGGETIEELHAEAGR